MFEIRLLEKQVTDAHTNADPIADAWHASLDVIKLLPFFMAVMTLFAEKTGIAREFVTAYMTTMSGWVCHKDLHGVLDPQKPDNWIRPRIFSTIVAKSNAGKSLFWRKFVDLFLSEDKEEPGVLGRLSGLFADSKGKGLHVGKPSNADFAQRMQNTQGHNIWAFQEAWAVLDTAWAMGGMRATKDPQKIDYAYLLEAQNGWAYGPASIKGDKTQYHCRTTQFGMFHMGQSKTIHDFGGLCVCSRLPLRWHGLGNQAYILVGKRTR